MTNQISKWILLTGAGFTKNFGGFLAKEMWSLIHNHRNVQEMPRVKEQVKNNFDYESIYHTVLTDQYSSEEKNAISKATFDAYSRLDDVVREWRFRENAPYPVNGYMIEDLLAMFDRDNSVYNFFFTLNQDLFIERQYHKAVKFSLAIPGARRIPSDERIHRRQPIDREDYFVLPRKEHVKETSHTWRHKNALNYIKLHGSFGWKSSDGSDRMVIGRNKEEQIGSEPLLSWYFEIFRKVLFSQDRKLMVIGYGFRDEHVNSVIADSVQNHGLQLYVICPSGPDQFSCELHSSSYGKTIWDNIKGYYPFDLRTLFPPDQSITQQWEEIRQEFFLA